jgi:hypothetical protein
MLKRELETMAAHLLAFDDISSGDEEVDTEIDEFVGS